MLALWYYYKYNRNADNTSYGLQSLRKDSWMGAMKSDLGLEGQVTGDR